MKLMSRVTRKATFCICENKDADQLRGKLISAFVFATPIVPLLPKSEISSFWPSSIAVQPGLFRTWSEPPKTGFLMTRLNYDIVTCNTSDQNSRKIRRHTFPNYNPTGFYVAMEIRLLIRSGPKSDARTPFPQ